MYQKMKNGLQNILAEIGARPEPQFLRIKVIITCFGKIINAGEMEKDPAISKILPDQNEFNRVYREVIADAENNLNLYEIYVSEKGIS